MVDPDDNFRLTSSFSVHRLKISCLKLFLTSTSVNCSDAVYMYIYTQVVEEKELFTHKSIAMPVRKQTEALTLWFGCICNLLSPCLLLSSSVGTDWSFGRGPEAQLINN